MLFRLIYASEPAMPLDTAQIEAILATARRNNPRMDITGMLAFDSRAFLQVLEGDRAQLSALYSRLVADTRHRTLHILGMAAIDARDFGGWDMGFAAANARHQALFLRHGSGRRFEPQRLSAAAAVALLKDLAEQADPGGPPSA